MALYKPDCISNVASEAYVCHWYSLRFFRLRPIPKLAIKQSKPGIQYVLLFHDVVYSYRLNWEAQVFGWGEHCSDQEKMTIDLLFAHFFVLVIKFCYSTMLPLSSLSLCFSSTY